MFDTCSCWHDRKWAYCTDYLAKSVIGKDEVNVKIYETCKGVKKEIVLEKVNNGKIVGKH